MRMRFASVLLALLLCTSFSRAQQPGPEQLFREAEQAQRSGDFPSAIGKYQELIRLHPDMVAARANLGVALASLGRFEEAIEQYQAALRLLPGNRDLRLNLALAYYKSVRLEEASTEFRAILDKDPKNVRIATLLSDCYLRLGKNEQVVALLSPFEQADPEDLAVEWALGSALIHLGHNREGLERVEKVAQQKHLPEAYAMAGEAHLRLEEFAEARDNIDTAMRLNPNLPGIYTLSGMVKEYGSDLEGAEAAYRQAIAANPKEFEPHLRLGAVLYELRNLKEAQSQLELALQIDSTSAYARFELAKVRKARGQMEEALKDFEQVAKQTPEWLAPHVELAALYYRLKRPADGAREKAIVDRLTEEERQRKSKQKVISPQLPSR
jgi:tetratricopeptide (TPR) repeat protein